MSANKRSRVIEDAPNPGGAGRGEGKEGEGPVVAIALVTDMVPWKMDKSLTDMEKYDKIQALVLCAIVNGDTKKPQFFVAPAVAPLFQPGTVGSIVTDLPKLLNDAKHIVTFNSDFLYASLRKYYPTQQQMVFWRLRTRDLFAYIKRSKGVWPAFRDLIEYNGVTFTGNAGPPRSVVDSQGNLDCKTVTQAAWETACGYWCLHEHVDQVGLVMIAVKKRPTNGVTPPPEFVTIPVVWPQ